jgi:hypothetical protein
MEMGPTLGQIASVAATRQGRDPDLAFVRGMLLHVEHLVILGTIADVSRDHRRALTPSTGTLHQAFMQYGPDIRNTLAVVWQLEEILLGNAEAPYSRPEYEELRQGVVAQWLAWPQPSFSHVDTAALADEFGKLRPRVTLEEPSTADTVADADRTPKPEPATVG